MSDLLKILHLEDDPLDRVPLCAIPWWRRGSGVISSASKRARSS